MIATIGWCCFGAFFSFLLLAVYRLNIKTEAKKIKRSDGRRYLLLIGCIGTMQATTNYAFAHMPVGYALSLFQLSVLVSVLLGYRLFGEQDVQKN